jgi:hypothetical protein
MPHAWKVSVLTDVLLQEECARCGLRRRRAPEKLAGGTPASAWDIIGIGSVDIVLVQVKTRDYPSLVRISMTKRPGSSHPTMPSGIIRGSDSRPTPA